jgi:DNA-directed RNA polymerase subunit M/transcription elongation factor TFIIS
MADKNMRYIKTNGVLVVIPDQSPTLVFIPDEKRWKKYARDERQIEDDDTYGGISYRDISPKEAKAIYKDCPPDGFLPREDETWADWKNRITTESDRERIRNEKKLIYRNGLKVISEESKKRDESSDVWKTTIVYECPCGKGKYIYWKEHTGFDDWGASLQCDECEKYYRVY